VPVDRRSLECVTWAFLCRSTSTPQRKRANWLIGHRRGKLPGALVAVDVAVDDEEAEAMMEAAP
jgi:hypothetical protein